MDRHPAEKKPPRAGRFRSRTTHGAACSGVCYSIFLRAAALYQKTRRRHNARYSFIGLFRKKKKLWPVPVARPQWSSIELRREWTGREVKAGAPMRVGRREGTRGRSTIIFETAGARRTHFNAFHRAFVTEGHWRVFAGSLVAGGIFIWTIPTFGTTTDRDPARSRIHSRVAEVSITGDGKREQPCRAENSTG